MSGCQSQAQVGRLNNTVVSMAGWPKHQSQSCTWTYGQSATVTWQKWNGLPLLATQVDIGIDYLLNGWLSIEWQAHRHYIGNTFHWERSCKWWTSEKLWNTAWDMWEQCNEALHTQESDWHTILEKIGTGKFLWCAQMALWPSMQGNPVAMTSTPQTAWSSSRGWNESVEAAIQWKKVNNFGTYNSKQWFMWRWVIHKNTSSTMGISPGT